MCYGVTLDEAKDKVVAIYNEAMFWKQYLFEPPICHATKDLIKLMVDLINDCSKCSTFEFSYGNVNDYTTILTSKTALTLNQDREHQKLRKENTALEERRTRST